MTTADKKDAVKTCKKQTGLGVQNKSTKENVDINHVLDKQVCNEIVIEYNSKQINPLLFTMTNSPIERSHHHRDTGFLS